MFLAASASGILLARVSRLEKASIPSRKAALFLAIVSSGGRAFLPSTLTSIVRGSIDGRVVLLSKGAGVCPETREGLLPLSSRPEVFALSNSVAIGEGVAEPAKKRQ